MTFCIKEGVLFRASRSERVVMRHLRHRAATDTDQMKRKGGAGSG